MLLRRLHYHTGLSAVQQSGSLWGMVHQRLLCRWVVQHGRRLCLLLQHGRRLRLLLQHRPRRRRQH